MKSGISNLAIIGGLALGYYCAALLGHSLEMGRIQAVPVWPPTGLALGASLILGVRIWPAVWLGAFLGHAASPEMSAVSPWQAIIASIGAAAGSTAGVVGGAWLTKQFAGGLHILGDPNLFTKFVLLAGVVCTALSPTLGVLGHVVAGVRSLEGIGELWLHWWLGEVVSAVVITPLVLAWGTRLYVESRDRLSEAAAVIGLLVVVSGTVFVTRFSTRNSAELDFLVIPVVLWAALRLGHRAATGTVLVLACVATFGTLRGIGPFADEPGPGPLLVLQAFIAVIGMMSSMVASGVWQRRQAESALTRSEEAYRQLFEANPQPACVCNRTDARILAANCAAQRVYGFGAEELLQLKWRDLQEPATRNAETLERLLPPGITVQQQHRRRDGTRINVEVVSHQFSFKGVEALVLVCTDVTQRKEAENQAIVFTNLGQRLSLARTQQEAARIIVTAADALFGWDACMFDMVSPIDGSLTMILGLDLIDGERKEVPLINTRPGPISRKVLSEGAQLVIRSNDFQPPKDALHFGDTGRISSSIMGVPIRRDERVIGLMSIQSYTQNAYTEDDLGMLQALADHCGGALERIRAEEEVGRLNRELRHHLEELQVLFAVAPVGIAVATDPELRSMTVNEAGKALFGISEAQGLMQIINNHPGAACSIRHDGQVLRTEDFPMHRAVRSGAALEKQELELHYPTGGLLYCYAYATPLFGDYGEIRGSLGIFVDLTARKQAEDEILRLNSELERRVRERTIQLEATNKELEAFSYSVSHDLRAPLRSIRGFSEVLLERYREQLDARGQEFLRRACDSCAHMDRLIEDLLKLSRVGRTEIQRQRVNLSQLATNILADLQKGDPQREVKCSIAPGLFAPGDERLLRVALDNLLRNSWKFTLKRAKPEIEFGFIPDREGAFFVRDNGAGFDPAFSSRLFSVFQRLHSASEFPGTGVGLATVQRIVRRHGGTTWAEGQVDQGACFYFTLPESGPESKTDTMKVAERQTPQVAEQISP